MGNIYLKAINEIVIEILKTKQKRFNVFIIFYSIVYVNLVGIMDYTVILKFSRLLKIITGIHPQSF